MKYIQLGNLVELKQGMAINAKSNHLVSKEETPLALLRIADMPTKSKVIFMSVNTPERFIASEDDIIYTRTGQVGLVFRKQQGVVHNNCFRVIPNSEEKLDKGYLYWYLSLNSIRNFANSIASGSAQPDLPHSTFKKIRICLPYITSQKKIAKILDQYDLLIENNNKRIKLLEQMAENLYKEWFVRFRFPGYENTKFVDGIPSDWQILRMSDFCYVTDGTHDSPKPINDGGVPLVTGKCIKNGFIDFNEPYNISYQDHESISKRSGLQTGDILFSNIGTVGTTCLVNYDREFSVKNVIIFKPGNIKVSNYLYSWLNSDSIQAIFATQTNGASQQFVGLNFMRRFKILVPSENVLDLYSGRIKPIRSEIVKLHDINENLTKQRDMLLPRLMSGKIEV